MPRIVRKTLVGMSSASDGRVRLDMDPTESRRESGEARRPSKRLPPKRLTAAKYFFSMTIILASLFLLFEFGWRIYLYTIGRGFWDNPSEFISPFFTAPIERQACWTMMR